jgi:hypothetical protein
MPRLRIEIEPALSGAKATIGETAQKDFWYSSVTSDKDPIEKNPKTGSEGKPAAEDTSGGAPVIRTIIEIPDSIIQEYRRNNEEQKSENRKNHTIAIWAVAGAWIYATIALFQWCEMRKTVREQITANGIATENLRTTERAYIVMKSPTEGTNQGRLVLRIMNTGRLPASEINTTIYVARERFPEVSAFGFEKICVEHKYGLPPGIDNSERLRIILDPWSDADWEAIVNHTQAIFVGVSLTYNDGFKADPPMPYEWCTQSSYDSVGKELNWITCPVGQIQWLKNDTNYLPCQEQQPKPNIAP